MTIIKSLTFDTTTGKEYTLKELFKTDSHYEEKLSDIIQQRIKDWKIDLLEPFNEIRSDQDFYIADTSLVIYFQLYEITPYYWGFPYFPIPILDLADIIEPDSPLDRMMAFT
nr:RsiV family protein [Sporosarcina sp. JAI121]